VLPVASFVGDAASVVGLVAAAIAVCGFLGQVVPALTRKNDQAVRAATGIGGLVGLAAAAAILIIGMLQ
jgi:uncharacterized protein with PQ loop repeat